MGVLYPVIGSTSRCGRLLVIGALTLAWVLGGCSRESGSPGAPTPTTATHPKRLPRPNHFQTHWQDEAQFIVESVATDLVEMALFAADGPSASVAGVSADAYELGSTKSASYEVVLNLGGQRGTITCVLSFEQPIWAPESYRPLTQALFDQLKLSRTPVPDVPNPRFLNALLTPTAEMLATLDLQLSKELAEHFQAPAKHDEAALLLASFALRETTGLFYEGRSELCRTTAHLAFADALRGPGEPSILV